MAERLGVLNDNFLGRARPLGESRVLWEVGEDGVDVRELRARLGLDSGYLSRVLRSLEAARLVKVERSRSDGRVRRLRLTAAGRSERAELDRRSDQVALSLLEPLDAKQRTSLLAAMESVERLLRASMIDFAIEDPTTKDARWCLEQYFTELNERFDAGFDPKRGISADPHELVPPAGAFVIARLRGRPVGCGALKFHGRAPTELKRMWISREVRGLGAGRRLLAELERLAKAAGARVVHLETNHNLKEAIALYRSAGYREVEAFNDEPYAHHWFEKLL